MNNIYQNYDKSVSKIGRNNSFQLFAHLYRKQINKINIFNQRNYLSIISHLSRFENIETLVINSDYLKINEHFIEIANNCQKLKRLSINTYSVNESFDRFKIFNGL
jgi:hypothetical protein